MAPEIAQGLTQLSQPPIVTRAITSPDTTLDDSTLQVIKLLAAARGLTRMKEIPEAKRDHRRRLRSRFLATLLVAAVGLGALVVADLAGPKHTVTAPCSSTEWELVDTPAARRVPLLRGVQSARPDDAWAVGVRFAERSATSLGLLMHWDGRSWVTEASLSLAGTEVNAVSGSSYDDVWAVGNALDARLQVAAVLHHDGERWTVVEGIPAPGGRSGTSLRSVEAIDEADHHWAVGHYGDVAEGTTFQRPFVLQSQRQGELWKQVKVPGRGFLLDVAASESQVWAAGGRQHTFSKASPPPRPMVLMWDGTKWRRLSHPLSQRPGTFTAVAIAGESVWVAGHSLRRNGGEGRPFLLQRKGGRWASIEGPEGVRADYMDLAYDAGGVWAVGATKDRQAFIGHWTGARWVDVRTLAADLAEASFDAIDMAPDGAWWAVGMEQQPDQTLRKPLIARKCPER